MGRWERQHSPAAHTSPRPTHCALIPCVFLRPAGFPTFLAAVRAVLFYLTTFAFAAPLFLAMLGVYPFCLAFDKYR